PTGATNHGPICYGRYPGAAGANSPAVCVINGATSGGAGGGGVIGNDGQRAQETNPYDGVVSWSRWFHISGFTIVSATDAARDGGPIELGSSSHNWRVFNCDLSWPTFGGNGSPSITNSAGINGNGFDCLYAFCYIHDV